MNEQESREDTAFTAGYDEGQRALREALQALWSAVNNVSFGKDAKTSKKALAEALKNAGTVLATPEREDTAGYDEGQRALREKYRAEFAAECERFHNEGHKCATCGRATPERGTK